MIPPPGSAPGPSVDGDGARAPITKPRPALGGPRDPAISDDDVEALWHRQLMVPVAGRAVGAVQDNFEARRGPRLHLALDLMAPRDTPVLAADDHVIGRLVEGPVGGIALYATDPSGRFVFYYAHLSRYRRGLAVGDTVAKGQVIGYVGSTGNASPAAPHLHFQVMKRGAGRAWWDGPPINPAPFFVFDGSPP